MRRGLLNITDLRRDSAPGATAIAVAGHAELERTLISTLRAAFVQGLQAKAFLTLAQENLATYDCRGKGER